MTNDVNEILRVMDDAEPKLKEAYSLWAVITEKCNEGERLNNAKGTLSGGQKILAVILFCFYIIPGIIYLSKAKRNKDKEMKRLAELEKEISPLMDNYLNLKLCIMFGDNYAEDFKVLSGDDMDAIKKTFGSSRTTLTDYIPEGYLFPDSDDWKDDLNTYAFEKIYGYFKTGRATTAQEALNLFEEEKHRFRLEANQQELMRQNRINTWTQIGANAAVNAYRRR